MDKFKEKVNSLRNEVDAANTRADEFEAKVRLLKSEHLQKDHEIASLKNQLRTKDETLLRTEDRWMETKSSLDEGDNTKTTGEGLLRKVTLIESQLETAERNLSIDTEKLRELEAKTEIFERQVQKLEDQKRDYEARVEDLNNKYNEVRNEMNRIMDDINEL
ncbi:tropomyosin [Mortierella sp. GBAus27b]|nr:hypothetical protein BGX31_002817 [Mortierella sp. GBA43]KAI8345616.1 tropomyosin [Mortierella sp. GBAus27b]